MFDDIDPADLIDFAKRWTNLGRAVQEQVEAVLADPSTDANFNAISMASRTFSDIPQILDTLEEWLADAR